MLTEINFTLVAATAGLGLGWWLRAQTVGTIQADITAIKQDILNIKNYFGSTPAPVVTVATPVIPAV